MFLELEEKIKQLATKVKAIEEKLGIKEETDVLDKSATSPQIVKDAKKDTSHKNLQTR